MSNNKTGNQTHDATVAKAESVKQSAVMSAPDTPTTAVAVIKAAEVTFCRAIAVSAIANGLGDGIGAYMTGLKALGRDLYS